MKTRTVLLAGGVMLVAALSVMAMFSQSGDPTERFRRMSDRYEAEGLAEPFKGVTTDGVLFSGSDTVAVRKAKPKK